MTASPKTRVVLHILADGSWQWHADGPVENRRRFAAGARRFADYLDAVPLIGHGPRRMAAALLREFAARADLTASRDEAAQRQAALPRAAAAE